MLISGNISRFLTPMLFGKKHEKPTETALAAYHGEASYRFHAPEFLDYERGPVWYAVAGVISLAIVAFGILTDGITFVLAYLLFVAVYFLRHHQTARLIEVAILAHGVRIDGEFFAWQQVASFWVVWDMPYVADLKFQIRRRWQPVVTVHIFGQDPMHLRSLLTPHIHFDATRGESHLDLIARALRL